MSTKPNILVFIDWFWPGYLAGGPVQSIVSLIEQIGADVNFKVITTNRDHNSDVAYKDITPDTWTHCPLGCEVYYADPSTLNVARLKTIIDSVSFDKVYINSFFSKNFSILPLSILNKQYKNTPVILAPRGMLGEGALSLKKHKKNLFILYSKLTGLHARVTWHATSTQEEQEIRNTFPTLRSLVKISNLPKKLQVLSDKTKEPGKLDLCFISRISEKKNLLFALEVLAQIKEETVTYKIYGPLEDKAYWEKCEAVIKNLPQNIRVKYQGAITPQQIASVLAQEHMMFLPTLNENFGHAIVESLLGGCPVIISDQTPWNDLETHGAGFAISLKDPSQFTNTLRKCAAMGQQDFSEMRQRAIKYISKKIDLDLIAGQYKALFNESIKN